jgi:hypothetical protein
VCPRTTSPTSAKVSGSGRHQLAGRSRAMHRSRTADQYADRARTREVRAPLTNHSPATIGLAASTPASHPAHARTAGLALIGRRRSGLRSALRRARDERGVLTFL